MMKWNSNRSLLVWLAIVLGITLTLSACTSAGAPVGGPAVKAAEGSPETVRFTLKTGIAGGKMAFIGEGGEIDGLANPDLLVSPGDMVEITLINGDGPEHDFVLDDLGVQSEVIRGTGSSTTVTFTVDGEGEFIYHCSLPGHQMAGMEGKLISGTARESDASPEAVDIVRAADDLPGPLGARPPQFLRVDLEAVELDGFLADGTTFTYWTFDGKVPGPFLRVRQGDTVEINLVNQPDSRQAHSIDLHAVTGPGGGAAVTQVNPGEGKSFTFKALNPGLYVYHCATPMVAHHIASGMYGLILVEPEGGLPAVDREFYVMQGEIYTETAFGHRGHLEGSDQKLLDERPEYFVFNGAVGALTGERALRAEVGETVRIFFGVGGPNFTSSFHVIGEIFDRVYDQASLTSAPLTDVQTTLVPPGGATVVEFQVEVPGNYILVDHALSRLERGLAGFLVVEGPANSEIFHSDEAPDGSH
jgi:nitrite reductase (NO-forming)